MKILKIIGNIFSFLFTTRKIAAVFLIVSMLKKGDVIYLVLGCFLFGISEIVDAIKEIKTTNIYIESKEPTQ